MTTLSEVREPADGVRRLFGVRPMLDPVERPGDGLLPDRVLLLAPGLVHLRRPLLVLRPVRAQVLDLRPEADRQAGGVGRAEGRRLGDLRPDDRHAQDVGLELHQHLVEHHAAVDLEGRQRDAGVGVHRVEDLAGLPGGRLEHGPGDVALVDVAGEAGDHAAGVDSASTARTGRRTPGRSTRRRCPRRCSASASTSADDVIIPRLSRSHWTSAPVIAIEPSRA